MVNAPTGLTIADHFDRVEITFTDNSDDEDQVLLERNPGDGWSVIATYAANTTHVEDDSPMFYGGVQYRVVHVDPDGDRAASSPVTATPAPEGEKVWSGGTSPSHALGASVSEAVDELIGPLEGQERELGERFLADPPEEFYVADFSGGTSTVNDRFRFASVDDATRWRDRMVLAKQRAQSDYPPFHDEYFGVGPYSPELTGPGLYAGEAADASLWDTFVQELRSTGNEQSLNRAREALGGRYEEIRLAEPNAVGTTIVVGLGSTPDLAFYRLNTGHSAPAGHLDAAASALQTFLEDGLATLQADHPDNFDEFFGYTSVPIVDTRA